MIREKTAIARHQKSGAKYVNLQRLSGPLCFESSIPFFRPPGLTRGIAGDTNQLSGILVPELHDHVQQADLGP